MAYVTAAQIHKLFCKPELEISLNSLAHESLTEKRHQYMKIKYLLATVALFSTLQIRAATILVGEFNPANSGDATEHRAIRDAITAYNGSHDPDLSQLFGAGTDPSLINGWTVFVAKTTDIASYGNQTLTFTAPNTFAEYYVFSKYGSGGANFDSALHHLDAGDAISYNPGGSGPPQGLSHIAIWARGTPTVPDSGQTIALLGGSLLVLAWMRRRFVR